MLVTPVVGVVERPISISLAGPRQAGRVGIGTSWWLWPVSVLAPSRGMHLSRFAQPPRRPVPTLRGPRRWLDQRLAEPIWPWLITGLPRRELLRAGGASRYRTCEEWRLFLAISGYPIWPSVGTSRWPRTGSNRLNRESTSSIFAGSLRYFGSMRYTSSPRLANRSTCRGLAAVASSQLENVGLGLFI